MGSTDIGKALPTTNSTLSMPRPLLLSSQAH
jgi:hypothetical protein